MVIVAVFFEVTSKIWVIQVVMVESFDLEATEEGIHLEKAFLVENSCHSLSVILPF